MVIKRLVISGMFAYGLTRVYRHFCSYDANAKFISASICFDGKKNYRFRLYKKDFFIFAIALVCCYGDKIGCIIIPLIRERFGNTICSDVQPNYFIVHGGQSAFNEDDLLFRHESELAGISGDSTRCKILKIIIVAGMITVLPIVVNSNNGENSYFGTITAFCNRFSNTSSNLPSANSKILVTSNDVSFDFTKLPSSNVVIVNNNDQRSYSLTINFIVNAIGNSEVRTKTIEARRWLLSDVLVPLAWGLWPFKP